MGVEFHKGKIGDDISSTGADLRITQVENI